MTIHTRPGHDPVAIRKPRGAARWRNALPLALLLSLAGLVQPAEPPSPDKLLGPDTMAILTTPNWAAAKAACGRMPVAQLWDDPAMKPFREKFLNQFQKSVTEPIEKELGIKLGEYSNLARGQITLAITQNGWGDDLSKVPGFLFLLDAGDQAESLTKALNKLKQVWVDQGNPLRKETIRDIEFSVINAEALGSSLDDVFGNAAAAEEEKAEEKTDEKPAAEDSLYVGQSGSILICGVYTADIEKVLIRQSGGSAPTLAEQPIFARDHGNHFRQSLGYAWINLKTILQGAEKAMAEEAGQDAQEEDPLGGMVPKPDVIMSALGLKGLESFSLAIQNPEAGQLLSASLRVPADQRKGLFKMFSFEPKESSPPPFVPADAAKFSRWRLDLPGVWKTIESTVEEVSPQFSGVLKLLIENAGKEQDPNFDLRKNLIGNLGDDIITYQKSPTGDTLEDLNAPPTTVLIGSPKPEDLAAALKGLSSLMPQEGGARIKEREFLGRTIYSMALPATANGEGRPQARTVQFVASGSYVAISTDNGMIEEFLRTSTAEPLRDTPGLREAAQQVGGMNDGFFAYENDRESARVAFRVLKSQSGVLYDLLSGGAFSEEEGEEKEGDSEKKATPQDWVDFSLLPPFEKVAKYFHISVYGMKMDDSGLHIKAFTPIPPDLRGSGTEP